MKKLRKYQTARKESMGLYVGGMGGILNSFSSIHSKRDTSHISIDIDTIKFDSNEKVEYSTLSTLLNKYRSRNEPKVWLSPHHVGLAPL